MYGPRVLEKDGLCALTIRGRKKRWVFCFPRREKALKRKEPNLHASGMRIFLSHSAVDRPLAEYLRDQLTAASTVATVFLASKPGHIPADQEWLPVIQRELKAAEVYFVLLTPNSVERPWVWFETGAAWMSERKLIAALAGGLAPSAVPLPISARQLLSLDRPDEAEAILSFLGIKLPDPRRFCDEIRRIGEQVVSDGLRESGWRGIEVGGIYYAWEGSLAALEDYRPESEPPGLIDSLRQAGLSPAWGSRDKLAKHRADGKLPVYATDRRTWRREIVYGDTVLLVSGPSESPEAKTGRIQRARDEKKRRDDFLGSRKSVELAQEEIRKLHDALDIKAKNLIEHGPDFNFRTRKTATDFLIWSGRYSVRLAWEQPYSDGIFEAQLELGDFDGLPRLHEDVAVPGREGRKVSSEYFDLALSPFGDWRWRSIKNPDAFCTAQELASVAATHLIALLETPPPAPSPAWGTSRYSL